MADLLGTTKVPRGLLFLILDHICFTFVYFRPFQNALTSVV